MILMISAKADQGKKWKNLENIIPIFHGFTLQGNIKHGSYDGVQIKRKKK